MSASGSSPKTPLGIKLLACSLTRMPIKLIRVSMF